MVLMKTLNIAVKRQTGAAVLVMTLVLVTISTLLILLAGNYGVMQSKSVSNLHRNYQAYEAAQAGMEYGINYLNQNNSTILANPVGGYIPVYSDSNTSNVTLANNAKYTISYTNPVANNYQLIKITSTGTNSDSTANKTVTQLIQFGSLLVNVPNVPIISQGNINLGGNSTIVNTYNNNTVDSGASVTLSGSSSTVVSSGTSSTPGNVRSDIKQNDASISSLSNNDFFATYFGQTPTTVKGSVNHYYSNSSSTNYSSTLNGMTGTSIWIDQTGGSARLNSNITIGSPTNPVLLIVNGNLNIDGNVTIYGYVFIMGDSNTTLSGNLEIIGGVGSAGQISATGSIEVSYSPSTLSNLQNSSSMRYYAKVPGSWKDF